MNKAFTLIELLVVVLIIGILAAVALPQYQKAVERSRIMALLPHLRYFANEAETYYLANGSYPGEDVVAGVLPISIPGCRFVANGSMTCEQNYAFDYNGTPAHKQAHLYACVGAHNCNSSPTTKLVLYLEHTSTPGRKTCSSSINGLCESLTGVWNDN